MSGFRSYWAVFGARFRVLLQYRAAALAGVGTQLFWGLIRVMIFAGFYASTSAEQPMTYEETVNFVWLSQAMFLLVMFRIDGEVAEMVRSGTVAYELVRPLDLYRFWLCRCLAARTAPLFLRMVPFLLLAGLFLGLDGPASPTAFLLFLVSFAGAILLGAAIATIMTTVLLWTMNPVGVNYFVMTGAYVFSGAVLPLPLYPDWMQTALEIMPFRGLADTPFRIYMGHMAGWEALGALAQQGAWIVAFVAAGRWFVSVSVRRVVAQGG